MLIQHTDELRHVGVRDLHVHGLHDHLPHQNRHIRGALREHLRKKHVNNLPPGGILPPAVPKKGTVESGRCWGQSGRCLG